MSSTFLPGGNAPSGCLSCGGAAHSGCACKHNPAPKDAVIQYTGGHGASPPGNQVPTNFVVIPQPKKEARPATPFVPQGNRADAPPPQTGDGGRFVPSIVPPMKQSNGKVPPARIFDMPSDQPMADLPRASMSKPTDLGGGQAQAPVPFLATTPMIGLAADPNPFSPYCGHGIDAASELCRAAGDAGLSDYCRQQLLAFLKSGSSQTLGSWIAAQELCDQAALRRAVGIAEASMAAKASSGIYDKPGFGNPFGVDGYAWAQDRVRKPSPFAYQGDGSTMDYRKPSGGMPNYHRASGGFSPSGLVYDANGYSDAEFAAEAARLGHGGAETGGPGNTFTASNIQAFNESQAGQSLYRQELAQAAAAAPPATPPVDYAAVIGSVGQAVGGVFAGINTAVNNAAQNHLRELEIEYGNNARGAQLALQRSTMEMQGEIARLSAQGTPAAQATVTALQQQVADANARLAAAAQSSQGMGGGTIAAIAIGSVAVLGLGAYVTLGGGKRR